MIQVKPKAVDSKPIVVEEKPIKSVPESKIDKDKKPETD
jgi:hypothetical protein